MYAIRSYYAGAATAQGKVQKVSKKLVDKAEDTVKRIGEAEKQLRNNFV